jgi:serine phosphatase RsbU (regulator of sigma subunit)
MENRASATVDEAARLRGDVDVLKAQLMNSSLINELTKVMHSCTDLEGITKTLLLGIQEILEFDRVVLLAIDEEDFCLKPQSWVGVEESDLKQLKIPLGFEGGEVTDAVFLNRHLIVDAPDKDGDVFAQLFNTDSYLVIPLLSKATRKCWEHKSCNRTSCPAYGSHNPFCWSIPGSGEMLQATSEDDRRRKCVKCPCFRCEGVFWMDRRDKKIPITSDDITTLTAVITQAGIIIENYRIFYALERANSSLSSANDQLKRLNHDLQIAQAKINNDLTHARTIQQGLLPQDLQDTADFAIGAKYIPALAVGGDYYDVFPISPKVYGVVVADVSGHGIASALIMSMAKILLKTYAIEKQSPQKTLERINETFLNEIKTDNFVTIFYGVFDVGRCEFHYTSAGHCPVLFLNRKTREIRKINADGLFLGVFPDMLLKEALLTYEPGQYRLVLYTDGLTETHNAEDEMFDLSRLEEISARTLNLTPRAVVDEILRVHGDFCGLDRTPEDDITLLVLDL